MGTLPPRLRPGDTVAVCAPASPVQPERLKVGLQALQRRYRVRASEAVWKNSGFLAGGDEIRVDDLNAAMADPDVRAVILARGGYGLTRILDRLDAGALRRDPKLLVGYSDATALCSWALSEAEVRPIHGPMVAHFGELGRDDQQWLVQMMEEPRPAGLFHEGGAPLGASATESVEGRLLGGNLCVLSHLVGTPHALCLQDAIWFVEEVGERPYAIDRFITHLGAAGLLTGVKAAVVGELLRCEETAYQNHPTAESVFAERLNRFGIPGLSGAPFGHGVRHRALPFGGRCLVDFASSSVELLEAAVA